ncbi:MAG: nucleoside kinase [Alkalispirochaetaceae bacterium]
MRSRRSAALYERDQMSLDQPVEVSYPDGSVRELPKGTSLGEALAEGGYAGAGVVAGMVNNEVRSLSSPVWVRSTVKPIALESEEGQRVYRRSLCFILAVSVSRTFPDRRLVIGHSLGNSYFYQFRDRETSEEELERIGAELGKLVAEDRPIERDLVSYMDALSYFEERGMSESARLLEGRNDAEIHVYRCADRMDISHGPLVDRTSRLAYYRLESFRHGFLLLFPHRSDPTSVPRERRSSMLFGIYNEYKQWGRILNVASVGRLNQRVERRQITEFIRVNEALQNKRIAEIADSAIAAAGKGLILIAGPSSSGKTTFTKKLSIQLTVLGREPVVISVDDYFLPREQTPLDEDGNYDFESIRALDIDLLNQDVSNLLAGEEVELPSFNFREGVREYKSGRIHLPDRGILLMEGIHNLNDELTKEIPRQEKFKIYVSALTQLNLDEHNRIATTDNRLIRRLVRDHQFRGLSAKQTLEMWPSVRRGEDRNIFPYQDTADTAFNSALDYELGILKNYAIPLLLQIKPYHEVYHEAARLMTFLNFFTTIPEKHVPPDSILREFIGDSGFHY